MKIGIDEVGRGPIAGPVVACSVAFTGDDIESCFNKLTELGVMDSKKLTQPKRRKILETLGINLECLQLDEVYVLSEMNLRFSLVERSADFIDQHQILYSSMLCMWHSCKNLIDESIPGEIIIDGNQDFNYLLKFNPEFMFHSPFKYQISSLIKGDEKHPLIGLASIIAKEFRDYEMSLIGSEYPEYGFEKHAGYGTKHHRETIARLGSISGIHRHSFKLI